MTTKRPLEGLVIENNMSPNEIVKLLENPKFDAEKRYTREGLLQFVEAVDEITSSQKTDSYQETGTNDGLIMLYHPEVNLYVVTVVENGVPQWSKDPITQHIDWENVVPSLDPLIDVLVRAGATKEDPVVIFRKSDKSRKTGRGIIGSKARTEPSYFVDPKVLEWGKENGNAIVYEYLGHSRGARKPLHLEGEAAQQVLGVGGYKKLREEGLDVLFWDWVSFVRGNNKRITQRRTLYVSELSKDPKIVKTIAEFYKEFPKFKENSNVLSLFSKSSSEVRTVEDMIGAFDTINYKTAREIYNWFTERISQERLEIDPHKIIDSLRSEIRINDFMRKMEPGIQDRVRECTSIWIRYAIASDDISKDRFIQESIMPILKGENDSYINRQFIAAAEVAKRLLHPLNEITMTKYSYLIRAAWMLGLMKSREEEREKTGRGAEVTYIEPVSHLSQRIKVYDPLLMRSLDELLSLGLDKLVNNRFISNRDVIANPQTYAHFREGGFILYDNLNRFDRNKFSWLQNPARPLISTGNDSYLRGILAFWYAIRKDEIIAKVKDYEQNAR